MSEPAAEWGQIGGDWKSESISELAPAFVKAQAAIRSARKNAENPYHKTKYADLSSVMKAAKDPLNSNGLALTQLIEPCPNAQITLFRKVRGKDDEPYTQTVPSFVLVTRLIHTSGQWIESRYPGIPGGLGGQAMGSAISFAKRYSLSAMLGVTTGEDDDGERAMQRTEAEKERRRLKQDVSAIQKKRDFTAADTKTLCSKWMEREGIDGVLKDLGNDDLRRFVNYMDFTLEAEAAIPTQEDPDDADPETDTPD